MNVPSKSQLTTLVIALCRRHVRNCQLLASQYSSLSNLSKRQSGAHQSLLQKDTVDLRRNGKNSRLLVSPQAPADDVLFRNSPLHGSSYHTMRSGHPYNVICCMQKGLYNYDCVRRKSKKKRSDSNDSSDSESDDNLEDDDFDAPAQFKVQTIHAPSLRIDAILSNSLGLSRHRLEDIFYGPGILLNGKKVLKKGAKVDEGDYVDAIMEKVEDQIRVKRVKLLKIGSEKTGTDKYILKVRTWKAPFLIDNPDGWKPS